MADTLDNLLTMNEVTAATTIPFVMSNDLAQSKALLGYLAGKGYEIDGGHNTAFHLNPSTEPGQGVVENIVYQGIAGRMRKKQESVANPDWVKFSFVHVSNRRDQFCFTGIKIDVGESIAEVSVEGIGTRYQIAPAEKQLIRELREVIADPYTR